MIRIGLTGGIASGKTLVSDELARMGATIIDADVLARTAVEPGSSGLEEIAQRFGSHLVLPDGSLDRAALGELVFSDTGARADLNAIVHPRVREAANLVEETAPADGVVVHVVPLLVETGQQDSFDSVVVVDVPEDLQLHRLMERNGLTRDQAVARVAAQASRNDRRAAADWLIDNSGTPEQTRSLVEELWRGLIADLRAP